MKRYFTSNVTVKLLWQNRLFQKKNKQEGCWGYNILNLPPTPWNFRFVTLPLEIPEKTSFHPWKFSKIVWHPLEIPSQKPRPMLEIPHEFLLEHPWKLCFFFNWPLELPNFLSSIPPLVIPCPQQIIYMLTVNTFSQWS